MMGNQEKVTDRFTAQAESGERKVIVEYTESLWEASFEGSRPVQGEKKRLATLDGEAVNFVGEGVYQIVATGTILRRVQKRSPTMGDIV